MRTILAAPLIAATLFGSLTPSLAAQEAFDFLRITVVDPDGQPVRGAQVEVLRFAGGDATYSNLDIVEARQHRAVATLPTAKNGSIGIQIPTAIPHRVRVDVAPYAIEHHRGVFAGQELTVQLRAAATVTGVVRDQAGEPLAAECVELLLGNRAARLKTACDEHGRFRFERVMPGSGLYVDVEASQAASDRGKSLDVAAGETAEVAFELDRGATVRGRITDADSGQPIAGATFAVCWTIDKPVVTDADGRYEWHGLGGPFSNNLFVTSPGYCEQQIPRPKAKDGVVELDLQLQRGAAIRGRILDLDGKPAANCYVAAVGMVHNGTSQETDWNSTRTDQDGRFTIADLRPELRPVLLLRHDLRATLALPIPALQAGAKPHDLGQITLRPRRIVQGTLLGTDGKPVANAKVKLAGSNNDAPAAAQAKGNNFGSMLASYLGRRSTTTDSRGRFFFGDLPDGTFTLSTEDLAQDITIEGSNPEPIELGR